MKITRDGLFGSGRHTNRKRVLRGRDTDDVTGGMYDTQKRNYYAVLKDRNWHTDGVPLVPMRDVPELLED